MTHRKIAGKIYNIAKVYGAVFCDDKHFMQDVEEYLQAIKEQDVCEWTEVKENNTVTVTFDAAVKQPPHLYCVSCIWSLMGLSHWSTTTDWCLCLMNLC